MTGPGWIIFPVPGGDLPDVPSERVHLAKSADPEPLEIRSGGLTITGSRAAIAELAEALARPKALER